MVFVRYENNGSIDRRTFSLNKKSTPGSYKNPYLQNGDLIYVDENLFTSTASVINTVTEPLRNILSTYALFEIASD